MSHSVTALVRIARLPREMKRRPQCKLLLLALAERASHDGTGAYPSVRTMAAECEMSVRTADACLASLRAAGIIAEQAPPRRHRPRTWRIDLRQLAAIADTGDLSTAIASGWIHTDTLAAAGLDDARIGDRPASGAHTSARLSDLDAQTCADLPRVDTQNLAVDPHTGAHDPLDPYISTSTTTSHPNTWERIIAALPQGIHRHPLDPVRLWFRPCRLIAETDQAIVVGVPNQAYVEMYKTHYSTAIRDAMDAVCRGKVLLLRVASRGAHVDQALTADWSRQTCAGVNGRNPANRFRHTRATGAEVPVRHLHISADV